GSAASPILIQGTGVWTIDDSYKIKVNAVNVEDGFPGWTYELPEAEWKDLAVGGNRAFVRHGGSLYALPVF
uniref:hypothetical protein n=1 Tax=Streptomyces glaucescens TaxID=1907 RepID=UPI00130277DE